MPNIISFLFHFFNESLFSNNNFRLTCIQQGLQSTKETPRPRLSQKTFKMTPFPTSFGYYSQKCTNIPRKKKKAGSHANFSKHRPQPPNLPKFLSFPSAYQHNHSASIPTSGISIRVPTQSFRQCTNIRHFHPRTNTIIPPVYQHPAFPPAYRIPSPGHPNTSSCGCLIQTTDYTQASPVPLWHLTLPKRSAFWHLYYLQSLMQRLP